MSTVGSVTLLVDFGVNLVEEDPTLTFITFLGVSLLAALGLRFSYYANQNMRQTRIDSQRRIWEYLQFIGALGALYALVWILEIVSSIRIAPKNGIWLAMIFFLVLSLRQISVTAAGDVGSELIQLDQAVRLGLIAGIVLYAGITLVFGESATSAIVQGLTGIGFLAYGVVYFRRQIASTRLQGTMLDSLVRHLLPVLTFGALVSIVALAIPLGTDRTIVLHVQLVFLIMTATALMTATIKLRQNLASL
ncbi:hypothetical protein [Halovenus sp. HT40]|uniref:hypothetical protein n=1 Tax=Halovenus sp. HT40 TaxID=3126691 RepID=UPI00300EBEC7